MGGEDRDGPCRDLRRPPGARRDRGHRSHRWWASSASDADRGRFALARGGDRIMSERGGALRRYLTRKAARKLVAKVGAVKLAAIAAAVLGAFLVFLIVLAALAGASSAGEGEGGMVCTTSGGSESPPA